MVDIDYSFAGNRSKVVCPIATLAQPDSKLTDARREGRMAMTFSAQTMVEILSETIRALVRKDGPDLSARQLGVLLICNLDEKTDHTVRGLASALDVTKPAISRALDRLTDLELAVRKVDPADRRSVLVQRTSKGASFMRDLRMIMATSAAEKEKETAASVSNANQPEQHRVLADA